MSFLLLRFSADSHTLTLSMKWRIFIWYKIVSLFLIGFNGILHLKRILCREQHITISNNNRSSSDLYMCRNIWIIDFYWIHFQSHNDKKDQIRFGLLHLVTFRLINERWRWEWMKNWPQLVRKHYIILWRLYIVIELVILLH